MSLLTHRRPTSPASTSEQRAKSRRRAITGWLFLAPIAIGVLCFQFVPIMVSLGASLTSWDGLTDPDFVGLGNYTALVTNDPLFLRAVINTVYFTVVSIPLSIMIGLGLALLVTGKVRGAGFFRAAYFAPYVTNIVAIGFVWFWFFDPTDGVINGLLSQIGIEGPAWLSSSTWALPAVIIVSIWQGVGYPMIILLAGLQGIPEVLYESARLDGARSWARTRFITLPLLTPHLLFLLITQFITSFQVFGLIFVMTEGGPGQSTMVYIYYLFQNAFALGRMGYASAMAWILFILIGAITLVQWRLQRKWVFYG